MEGLRFSIPRPELCCDIGWWFFRKERYPEAAWWYRRALENRKTAGNEGFIQEELRGYVPCLQLCVCYDRMGKRDDALRCAREAMDIPVKVGTLRTEYMRQWLMEYAEMN